MSEEHFKNMDEKGSELSKLFVTKSIRQINVLGLQVGDIFFYPLAMQVYEVIEITKAEFSSHLVVKQGKLGLSNFEEIYLITDKK